MTFEVLIENTNECFTASEHESVLTGMARMGRKGIPVGCRGGGCGVCKVQITKGKYQVQRMSRQHISVAEEGSGVVLACCIVAQSDLSLRVVGKLNKVMSAAKRSVGVTSFDIKTSAWKITAQGDSSGRCL